MSLVDVLADAPQPKKTQRETADEAAERLSIKVEEAEALRGSLGCHYDEIGAYEVTDNGPVVTAKAGSRMIFRGESNPDANGNSGWLLVERPDHGARRDADGKEPDYATPVFAAPAPPPAKPAKGKKADD